MKTFYVFLIFIGLCLFCLKFNWVKFVSYTEHESNSINLSNQSIRKLSNMELSFFRIEPIDNRKIVYDLILAGQYDKQLIEIASYLNETHYVSIAPFINTEVLWNVYSNNVSKDTYINVYNYIVKFLNQYSKGNINYIFEVTVVSSWFRSDTLPLSYYDELLNCDLVGFNISSFDATYFKTSLNSEIILNTFLDRSKFNSISNVGLIDIPISLAKVSFLKQLTSNLKEFNVIIAKQSFFSIYQLNSFYNKLFTSIRISLTRSINFGFQFFSGLKPIFGHLFYTGFKDYNLDIYLGDNYLTLEITDDFLIDYTKNKDIYDRIYLCDDLTTPVKEGYMVYFDLGRYLGKDLDTFEIFEISKFNKTLNKLNLSIELNKLSKCEDLFVNPVQIYDYDKKNEFTVLHYMN